MPDAVGPPRRGLAGPREERETIAPQETTAFGGYVLTPDEAIEHGYVVVEGHEIAAVEKSPPEGARIHETDGVIVPGLIDLHGHPEFNVFAAWEPPKQFDNRYCWRKDDLYHLLVRDPQNAILAKLPPKTQLRYAEIRALVGGVTAIQGTGKAATTYQDEALVRNVDKWIFGGQVGRSLIDLPDRPDGQRELSDIMADPAVKAFYIHLAEGKASNQRSVDELDTLVGLGGLAEKTVVIHGTALSEKQLGDLKDAHAKLVWSPQSNLRLYGETTLAAKALELEIPLGLGADWLPSGSTSLLAELKVARRVLFDQGAQPTSQQLVRMVTHDAAAIAGLDEHLGTLAAKRPADLVVFERREEDPWDNVVEAEPSWVELVMIDGDIPYGRRDWVEDLAGTDLADKLEPAIAWGKRMLLDTSYQVRPDGETVPTLSKLRADLIAQYPQVGPIFA